MDLLANQANLSFCVARAVDLFTG